VDAVDLEVLPAELRAAARVAVSGEVIWPLSDAPAVIMALAQSGRLVLGLDLRNYSDDGSFYEIAWSSYDGADVLAARDSALLALSRADLPGDWVLITW
jgi:hypothetical protein